VLASVTKGVVFSIVSLSGSLNFNHAGIIASKLAQAVIMNGKRGETFSYKCPPIYGAGNENNPRLD
jgi:hypothetical protein